MSRSKYCILILLMLIFLIFLTSCSVKQLSSNRYEIGKELTEILWNVDYRSFTAENTTIFAKKYYESSYLEYYLKDEEYNAGVLHVQETQLISRLLSTENMGEELENLDGVQYTIQKLKVNVAVDHFRPEYPEQNYFEEGETYSLIYYIYFIEQNGQMKISGFSYLPEDGEMLPLEHRQKLTQEQKEEILSMTNEYLAIRYQLDAQSFSPDQAWAFYQENLSGVFLERDEISLESLKNMTDEYKKYGIKIQLMEKQLEAGETKTLAYDGYTAQYYYWVKAEYSYKIFADDPLFFSIKGVNERENLKEMLYFELQEDGTFQIVFAEYIED